MVGREAELAMLLEAFGRAEAGEAQVAVVTDG
jgi:predicted ATPase